MAAQWHLLTEFLDRADSEVELTWAEMDAIVGGLPLSSVNHYPQWWHGDRPNTRAWRAAGYEATDINPGVSARFVRSVSLPTSRELKLWETYSREEVHDIFAPNTAFTPQAGTWGMHGTVPIPDSNGDFVFFVTFGSKGATHEFQEEISEDGVLTWQSQPRNRLDSPRIQQFIAHNDLLNTIHLFLRTNARIGYTYSGELGYLDHDPNRESPVHFTWQLMNWPAPARVRETLKITPTAPVSGLPLATPKQGQLTKTAVPQVKPPGLRSGGASSVQPVLPGQDAKNRKLGLAGETLVLKAERDRLHQMGRADLASRIVHVSVVEGDAAGYDIRSFNDDDSVRHVEVKTTQGPASNAFFVSPNELMFSEQHPESYVLIRVHRYDYATDSGSYYEVAGPLSASFDLTTTEYRARLLPQALQV